MRAIFLCIGLFAVAGVVAASAATREFDVTVAAGEHDRANSPVCVALDLPDGMANAKSVVLAGGDGKKIPGQLTGLGLLATPASKAARPVNTRELHFILPDLKAGLTANFKATVSTDVPPATPVFAWHNTPGSCAELRFADRPVMRYMYRAYDDSSSQSRELTYKPYHHVFDPSGTRPVTKGPGGQDSHHRGLFYGFRLITYDDGKMADVWHCLGDAHQSHAAFLSSEAGPVLGRHRVLINWHGVGKEVFAREEREMTAYNVPGGILIEFASRLRSTDGKIHLDGDPQHGGFHFRADNEVARTTFNQTYFIRPDGIGKPGDTRNWPDNPTHVNLPWDAMSFVLGNHRYTAAILDKPTNPKEARDSERAYGRFGSYFVYDLEPGAALDVNYRVWLQDGPMTVPEVAEKSADFVEPVAVTCSEFRL